MSCPAEASAGGSFLRARSIGREARRALVDGARGRVLAVFASTIYLDIDGAGLVCVVAPGLPGGPINVVVDHWSSGLARHAPCGTNVKVDGASVRVADEPLLDLSGAAVRAAPRWAAVAVPPGLSAHVELMAEAADANRPQNAIAGALIDRHAMPAGGPVAAALRAPLSALIAWVESIGRGSRAPVPEEVALLLGAGEGLTPAGDDVLVGVLVALRAFGQAPAAAELASLLASRIEAGTNAISAAHLRAAFGGDAVDPVIDAIRAIRCGRPDPRQAAAALARYGASSGWEALAGVVAVARAAAGSAASSG